MIRIRSALQGLTVAAALAASGHALAQAHPSKPIRLIVPYGAGTPPDISSRLIAVRMGDSLGQPIIVENKPGATGLVGLKELGRAPADGYTLYTFLTPQTVTPVLYPGQIDSLLKEIEPIGQYDKTFSVLVVHPGVAASSVKDLVGALKAKPGEFSFPSGGNATPAHLMGELFKQRYDVAATHVPYNQFPQAIADLTTGRTQFMFLTSTVAVPNVQAGKLRAIAVTGEKRLPALPSVPTVVELGHRDLLIANWDGLVAKAGTPRTIIERLNTELNKAVANPHVAERLVAMGNEPVTGTPEQFRELITAEIALWTKVARAANIKVD